MDFGPALFGDESHKEKLVRGIYGHTVQRRIEMAAKRIKPNQSFSMEQDGFFGEYYKAKDNAFLGKCMIAFGGSVGKFLLSRMMAWEFAAAGMDVLILAYHGEPGLVGGKVNLPPHGKEFFHAAVSSFLHPSVRTFLHDAVS